MVEKRLKVQGSMALGFVDLEKAFDTVPREMVLETLRWMEVPEAEVRIVEGVADWPTDQSLFLMLHPDVSLVNILLSITRVSLVRNKFVFCQLRVHYIGDPDITKTYLGIQHINILQYLHELNGNVH